LGQCVWSADYEEQVLTNGYSFATFSVLPTPPPTPKPTPTPRPPVPPEPVPELLEPNGRIFSARIHYAANPDAMGLTFGTPNNTNSSYRPVVRWARAPASECTGQTGGAPEAQPSEEALRWKQANCNSSAPRSCYTESPVMHYCTMHSLVPGDCYRYRIGDLEVGLTGESDPRFVFRAAPVTGVASAETTVTAVLYGDMGLDYSEESRAMLGDVAARERQQDGSSSSLAASNFDWVIHNGDISYADNQIGRDNGTHYNDWMDVFYANASKYSSRRPYMTSPGNHEYPCDYIEYEARSAMMPFAGSGSTDMQYYSYTVGPVHVIALSGEESRLKQLNTTEMDWLRADLAKAAAARARGEIGWIITHVHYPNVPTGYCSSIMPYCCAAGNVGEGEVGLLLIPLEFGKAPTNPP
jgi:hypothetical protein